MKNCPCCKHGELLNTIVKLVEEEVTICEECEVVWVKDDIINENTGTSLYRYATRIGIKPLWSELIIQG